MKEPFDIESLEECSTVEGDEGLDNFLAQTDYIFLEERGAHKLYFSNAIRCSGWRGTYMIATCYYSDEEPNHWSYKLDFYDSVCDAMYTFKS